MNSPQPGIEYTLIGLQGGNDPTTGDIYRGLDLFSRVQDLIWVPYFGSSSSSSSSSSSGPGTNLVRIQHTYDRMSNRVSRRDLVAESYGVGLDELYQYDLINRLNELNRGTLNSGATGINPGTGRFNQCWTLDTTVNWSGFREDDTGSGTWDLVQSRTSNTANEITNISNTAGPAWIQPKYDAAGNMTTVPQPADPTKAYNFTYDGWNRAVKAADASTGHTVAEYAYDGAKRRTIKNSYTAGVLSETRHFFYTDPLTWQVVEERVGTSTIAKQQFIWGLRYIDDLLCRDRDTTGVGTLDERVYGLQDPNWNIVAIANSAGVIQERYVYDGYGTAAYRTGAFAIRTISLFAWEVLYAGYRRDADSDLFPVRHRVYGPYIGWSSRDPSGNEDVNLYRYVLSRPLNLTDPTGLDFCEFATNSTMGDLVSCLCALINALDAFVTDVTLIPGVGPLLATPPAGPTFVGVIQLIEKLMVGITNLGMIASGDTASASGFVSCLNLGAKGIDWLMTGRAPAIPERGPIGSGCPGGCN